MKLRLLYLLGMFLVVACANKHAPLLAAELQLARPLPGMRMSAGYLTLTNNSDQQVSITRVHSAQLESVEMHESVVEDGVSRMYKLQEVVILPGHSVNFEPGGKHLMLRYGATIPAEVTLQFYAGETLLLSVGASLED
jgi:copper(I)-binding protein